MSWPEWWEWEIELTSHLLRRMIDLGFSETDLRTMLTNAYDLNLQPHGTYEVRTVLEGRQWAVIVAPDRKEQRLLVISAFPDD